MKTKTLVDGFFVVILVGALGWLAFTVQDGCRAKAECDTRACPPHHVPVYMKAEGSCVCFVEALVPEG
jgi:hypothetical protein